MARPRIGRPKNRGSTNDRDKKCFSSRNFQIGSGAHRASRLMITGGTSQGVKRPEIQAEHTPPSGAEVKNKRI